MLEQVSGNPSASLRGLFNHDSSPSQPNVFKSPEVKELGHVRLQFADSSTLRLRSALFVKDYDDATESWVRQCTRAEIALHNTPYMNNRSQLDVIRDICNNVPMRWVAHKFGIPLKSPTSTSYGTFSTRELQKILVDLFNYSTFDGMTVDAWKLRENAKEQWNKLDHVFRARLYRENGVTGISKAVQDVVMNGDHVHASTGGAPVTTVVRKMAEAAIHPLETISDASKTVTQMYTKVRGFLFS